MDKLQPYDNIPRYAVLLVTIYQKEKTPDPRKPWKYW